PLPLPPRSTLFPTRRSSDLLLLGQTGFARGTLLLTGTNAAYSTDRGATVGGLYSAGEGGAIGVDKAGTTLTVGGQITGGGSFIRSEEHTSELQSRGHLVCRL